MKDLSKSALTIVGFLFALLLLGFTGVQTYTLLLLVSGSAILAVIGLSMFEGGMIYWWQVFRAQAEGLLQMALSLLVFLACLTFVVMATALKLGAVDATVLGANTAAKLITAAAVIQLAAKLLFPLLHPDVMEAINERVKEGKILEAADKKFDKRVDGIADQYTDAMVEEKTARLLTRFNTKYHTSFQLPDGAAVVVEGQAVDVTPPARRSFIDRLRGRAPESNSTHDTDAAEDVPAAGQGTRQPAYAALADLSPAELRALADLRERVHVNGQEANGSRP